MKVIRLVDEADVRSRIDGKTYEDTLVVGPAMIALVDRVSISDSAFEGEPDAIFFEVPEGRLVVGVIGLTNVTFRRCRFENVGIVGTADSIAKFTQGFPGNAQSTRPRGPGRAAGDSHTTDSSMSASAPEKSTDGP